jgi:signal transduction histidine kinase
VLEERQRLAPDLHDSVGAMLRLTAGVGSLGEHFGALPEVLQRIETIEGQVPEAAQMLRQSLWALSSPPEAAALAVTLRSDARPSRTGRLPGPGHYPHRPSAAAPDVRESAHR